MSTRTATTDRSTARTAAASAALVGSAAAVLALTGTALAGTAAAGGGAAVAQGDAVVAYPGFPVGATARVHSVSTPSGRTTVTLEVTGLDAGRTYGAHAHVGTCGSTGAAAGPHWQYEDGAPTSPEFANPRNEVWLDVTVGADGTGRSKAVLDVAFQPEDRPRSVIIHSLPTATGQTDSGVAGPRLACVPVAF